MSIDRRRFIATAGAVLAAGAVAPSTVGAARARSTLGLPAGLQLWSVKEELAKDFDGTLRALRRIGYRRIEAAGWAGRTPAAYRKAILAAGLEPYSCHFGMRDFIAQDDAAWDKLREARDVGMRYVVASSPANFRPVPEGMPWGKGLAMTMTLDDWRRNADAMNAVGARAKAMGMRFGYHNHAFEFLTLDDVFVYGELDRRTDPSLVAFEMDLAWVAGCGYDPADMLRRFAPRIELLHVKDIETTVRQPGVIAQNTQTVPVGSGSIEWASVFAQADAAPIKSWFVEQEPPFTAPALDGLEKSLKHLNAIAAAKRIIGLDGA